MPFRAFLVCLSCKDICSYFVQLFFFLCFPTKYIKNRTCVCCKAHIVISLWARNPMTRRWGSLCLSENNDTKVLSTWSSNGWFLFLNLLKHQTSLLIGNFESAILTIPPYGKFSWLFAKSYSRYFWMRVTKLNPLGHVPKIHPREEFPSI